MADTEITFMATEFIDGAWFNSSESRFALVPGRSDEPLELQKAVEDLIRKHAGSDSRDVKNEVVGELMDLHAQGLILWPLGALWGRSALGDVNEQRFARSVEEHDLALFEVRSKIHDTQHFEKSKWTAKEKNDRSFIFWKLLAALHFAAHGIDDLAAIQEVHIYGMAKMLQPDTRWLEWVPQWTRKNIRYFASFLGELREDPLFAVGIRRDLRQSKVAPRMSDILRCTPHLRWLEDRYEIWINQQNVLTKTSYRDGSRLLLTYLSRQEKARRENGYEILSRAMLLPLLDYAKTWQNPTTRINAVLKVHAFTKWMALAAADMKVSGVDIGLLDHDVERFCQSVQVANKSAAHSEVRARPMPVRYHHKLKDIISENDFAWPKSLLHRQSGKPLHWITWFDPETGTAKPVFCEVLPRLLLLHLELPLRNVQARRLDSGEGDSRMWDPDTNRWKAATGAHIGHWEREKAKNPRRGVFREIQTLSGQITGFWINSNKTQDGANLFGETSGYEMPWQHDEVLRNLAAMRSWQEKYNPVTGPLKHEDLIDGIFDDDPSDLVKAIMPSRFYLFRYPPNVGPRGNEAPVGYKIFHQFFHDALEELERRLCEEDPEFPIRIITGRDKAGAPKSAIFTIHGMRSSTLTTLYMAGVPIEILSKVVAGHATILMTLKYTKFDPVHVNEILTQARMQAMTAARNEFPDLLANASLEQAMQMTARLSEDGLHQIKGSFDEPSAWGRFDIGICPNSGTQCHVGGPAIIRRSDKGKNKSSYGPVPGGGRNCVRCRFFVTGLPFLIPLWAHANAIFAKIDRMSKKMDGLRKEIDELKDERQRLNAVGEQAPRRIGERIRILDETWVTDSGARDQALADAHATMLLIEKIRAIASSNDDVGGDTKVPMLLPGDAFPDVVGRESTRFELVDAVVQASRWFPSIEAADLEMERDEFLNNILYRNGYVPITVAPLGKQERRRAADALATFLLVELKAAETQNLIDGKKTFADYQDIQERLEMTASRAIGRPLERLALPQPSRLLTIDVAAE